MTNQAYLKQIHQPTIENPLRILTSACLMGTSCEVDATSYGQYPGVLQAHVL